MKKRALITGVTGQDGSYLSKLLLEKGYEVYGIQRRSSTINTHRLDQILKDRTINKNFFLHYGDLSDGTNIVRLVSEIQPDEIYNLGAMSQVQISSDSPEYTANIDGVGALRVLEAIRICGLENKTKFYQASTSELFGKVTEVPQTEKTPFYPRSPYGVAKLYAHWITVNYREMYNLFACNGILFNHESPIRGEEFVTRKITKMVAKIFCGQQGVLSLGNLDTKRDWGYAKEYVEGMWLMLQQESPGDFILATGKSTSVRELVELVFRFIDIEIEWIGERGSLDEIGINKKTGKLLVNIDPRYYRNNEVDLLLGDPSKAKEILGWEAKMNVGELAYKMLRSDIDQINHNNKILNISNRIDAI